MTPAENWKTYVDTWQRERLQLTKNIQIQNKINVDEINQWSTLVAEILCRIFKIECRIFDSSHLTVLIWLFSFESSHLTVFIWRFSFNRSYLTVEINMNFNWMPYAEREQNTQNKM